MAGESLPYGLRDVKLSPMNSDGSTYGTSVDLPNSRTFTFEEAESFDELTGDDKTVATHGQGALVNWELEAGGISLEAYLVLNGGTLTLTGTAPSITKSYDKKVTDARPYFKAEGQAISDSGGDFHATVYRCKATGNLTGAMTGGAFWLTKASGQGLALLAGANVDKLYNFTQNPAVTAIS